MRKKGIVFDIQRFSIHDGPGIRTTVFLKGCPLRCAWCHNPESWMIKPQLMFYEEKCVHCLECVRSCPNQVHKVDKDRHIVDFSSCKAEGKCAAQCAYGALKLSGTEMSVSEIMEEVVADTRYYQNSGGGLTISGGEPMLQFEFLQELLEESKKMGIHNCIETSGYAERNKFERIMKDVDLFLFDIKHINAEEHIKYTGVSNSTIFSNLDYLYQAGANILLRCPIIPGINDTKEHIGGVAELTRKYPNLLGVEIMPYHDMGKGKWSHIGRQYDLTDLKNMSDEQKSELLQKFRNAGCQKVTI